MNKELSYLLGFFYADGWIGETYHKLKTGPKTYYSVRLEIVSSDAENIKKLLDSIGILYTSQTRIRKNSDKEQTSFNLSASDPHFELFRVILANKIDMSIPFSKIPSNFHRYFLRGFFDGDGCINIHGNSKRLYFYGSYDQDWSPILSILGEIDAKHTYQKIVRKSGKHKSSHICISNMLGISKFYEYIYPNGVSDFGLHRKYEKLQVELHRSMKLYRHKPKSIELIKTYT